VDKPLRSFVLAFIVSFALNSGLHAAVSFQWRTGESLTYKVEWSYIRLGTVNLTILDSLQIDSVQVHHVRFTLNSNPVLFFVNMHSVFDCYLDNQLRPIHYVAKDINGKDVRKAVYNFFYADSFFTIDFSNTADPNAERHVKLPLKEPVYDGISMAFFARGHIHEEVTDSVTAFLDDNLGRVALNFRGAGEPVRIKAIPKKIPTYYIDGNILMKGIAGVTGPFKGWFAQDGQRPPLRAYLKVFIGNVILELEKWERWDPQPLLKD
jgi:hypothetical protein